MSIAAARRQVIGLWVPVLVVILDQVSKALVRAELGLHESITVIPGFMDFTHVRNTGAAFGMLNAADFPGKTILIGVVACAGLLGIGIYSARLPREQLWARLGLALILGGAAGNLIDRITEGSVVDFVDVYFGGWHFWAFNVADSAITVGVSIILLDLLLAGAHVSTTA